MNGELNFEHVCSLLATDYIFMPTKSIYDKQISSADDYFNGYNIYFIGKFPNISPGCRFENSIFYCDYKIGDKKYPISIKIPNELIYSFENGTHYFKDLHGNSVLEGSAILNLVTETYNPGLIDFDVQYIGQSIGNDGTRNFLDRVKNHEKLQQIYVDNENNESKIGILAFKVSKDQTLISIIPPSGAASSNILEDGFNLMENLTIEEIVTLFEASFIKYFRPKYNKYFKDNFPSSNMKCLRSLYGKDFFGISAEISFRDFPFNLYSDFKVKESSNIYAAYFDLNSEDEKRRFFNIL